MDGVKDGDFARQREEAEHRLREMEARARPQSSARPMPPVPPFVRVPGRQPENQREAPSGQPESAPQKAEERRQPSAPAESLRDTFKGLLSGLGLPFFDGFGENGDLVLILGLLLILWSEKADRRLLFALLYILL